MSQRMGHRPPDSGARPGFAKGGRLFRLRHRHRTLMLGQGAITIGRRPSCDLVVTDPAASREHARLIVGDQSATIEDLGSHNGVFVNGKPIRGIHRLSAGDKIEIGQEQIEVIGFEEPSSSLNPQYDEQEATSIGRRLSLPPFDEDNEPAPTQVSDPRKPR